ncbi:MAG: hypothetical protein P8017_05900 [Deltaproteobacteria bacterium]
MKTRIIIVSLVSLLLAGTAGWAGEGALVVFDNPSYPPTLPYFMWADDHGSGLTVVMALWDDSEPILDNAVEVFLPDTAMKFTPDFPFPIPDTINYRSNNVPVAVYADATPGEIVAAYSAYDYGGQEFLENQLVASGFVKGCWVGKNFKATLYSVKGPVDLVGGGQAILIASGHEVFNNGPLELPETHDWVGLH